LNFLFFFVCLYIVCAQGFFLGESDFDKRGIIFSLHQIN
jgi:hypothetical protein